VTEPAPVVRVDGLTKTFGGTRALDGVSLEVRGGEVHALLGQNGSGKSTLIKILSGYHTPDAGSIAIRGEPVRPPLSAAGLRRLGVTFVHQDLGLVGTMSVLENLRVGRFDTGPGRRIRWGRERERARDLLRRFDLDVDPRAPVGSLTQTERVIVAVIRALQDVEAAGGRGLLVLDEPTSALPLGDVHRLFSAMRRVTAGGSGVLFVTHDVDEVFEISDRATILRDGHAVATVEPSRLDHRELVKLIVGRDLVDLYPPAADNAQGTLLTVHALSGDVAREVSFNLRRGEILGLTGLLGAGHDEVPYLIYGARAAAHGQIEMDGVPIEKPSPQSCTAAGIALLPNDRQRLSAIPAATVKENVTLPDLRAFRRGGRLDHRRERTAVEAVISRVDVRPRDPDRPLIKLSGGNQQKAVLARWLRLEPRVLLLHEPTQGVDVGAKSGIFQILRDAVAQGTSIIYASAEYEDLANICDRVLVFRRGRLVSELEGERLRHDVIVSHCYASSSEAVVT
jgi:ribose transport system ATP-binding protein